LIFDSDASSATPQLKPPGGLTRSSSISLCFGTVSLVFLFSFCNFSFSHPDFISVPQEGVCFDAMEWGSIALAFFMLKP
jgi:hypothetical protein